MKIIPKVPLWQIKPYHKIPDGCGPWLAYNGHEYWLDAKYLVDEHKTYDDAKSSCQDCGSYLASVTIPEEDEFLRSQMYDTKS